MPGGERRISDEIVHGDPVIITDKGSLPAEVTDERVPADDPSARTLDSTAAVQSIEEGAEHIVPVDFEEDPNA